MDTVERIRVGVFLQPCPSSGNRFHWNIALPEQFGNLCRLGSDEFRPEGRREVTLRIVCGAGESISGGRVWCSGVT
jgi:hypothetical protein